MDGKIVSNKRFKTINGFTKISVKKLRYDWRIENYNVNGKKPGEFLVSPTFSDSFESNQKWVLHLYPKGRDDNRSDSISLFLRLQNYRRFRPVEANFDLSILDKHGNEQHKKNVEYYYEKPLKGQGCSSFVKYKVLKRDDLLINNSLTIRCEITAATGVQNLENQIGNDRVEPTSEGSSGASGVQLNRTQSIILTNLGVLFNNQSFSDVLLLTCGAQFHAHKVLLAAQSPILSRLFEQNSKAHVEVKMNDVKSDALQEFLRFIYSGKIENFEALVEELLDLAIKYEVDALKVECQQRLRDNLCIKNVVNVIILADKYDTATLRKQAIDYFVLHGKEFSKDDKFVFMKCLKQETVLEITQALLLQ